jgi:hypothetical protein
LKNIFSLEPIIINHTLTHRSHPPSDPKSETMANQEAEVSKIARRVTYAFNDTGGIGPEDPRHMGIYAGNYPRANGARGVRHVFLIDEDTHHARVHVPHAYARENALDQETFVLIQASHPFFKNTCVCQYIVLEDDDHGGHWMIWLC